MRSVLFLVPLIALASTETISLEAVSVDENALLSGHVLMGAEEATETESLTVQDRLQRDVAFSIVPDIIGEGAVSFRGLDFKATEYVEDGIPLYRSANGVVDTKINFSASDLYMNDGSGSSIFGVSPIGGEVTIASHCPHQSFESRVDTTVSTNDEYLHGYIGSRMKRVYVQADADTYHRSDYALSDDYESTPLQGEGKRINSDKQRRSVSLKSGIVLNDTTHLAAKASLTRSEYGIPTNIYTDLEAPVWDAFSRISQKELKSFYLYGDYDADSIVVNWRGYYDDYEDVLTIYDDASYQSKLPEVTYDDSRLGTVLTAAVRQNAYEASAVLQTERNEHIRSGGAMETARYLSDLLKGSLVMQWHMNRSWDVEGAISYTFLQAKEAADDSAAEPADGKTAFDALAKLTYEDEGYTLYGSVAKKSRMPTMNEMFTFFPWYNANPSLHPEKSVQMTAGYQQMLAERTMIDFALYYYDIRDLILFRNNGFINRDEAKHYGVEVRLESTRFNRQNLRFSYAYAHARDSEGEALEMIPSHQVKLEDTVTIATNWQGYLGYRYVSSRYSANTATYVDDQYTLNGYHLVDIQLSYALYKNIICRAGIKNLLDEAYEWQYGYPAEGRSFYASLELVLP